jgi:streptogramin lyase
MFALYLVGCVASKPIPETATRVVHHTNVVTTPTTSTPCEAHRSGVICTIVGIPGIAAFADEGLPGRVSALYLPVDMTFDAASGELLVLDWNNHRLRTLQTDGNVVNLAGTGFIGDGIFDEATGTWTDGDASAFAFDHPSDIAIAPDGSLYIAAYHNSRVDRLSSGEVRYFAGNGQQGYGGDDGPAAEAVFDLVPSIALADDGTLYASDQGNAVIRAVAPDGTITRFAGTAGVPGYTGDGGPALEATIGGNSSAVDPSNRLALHDGGLYLADTANDVIRRIDLASGEIETVVGLEEELARPRDIAFGPDGTLFIADTDNHCIRAVDIDGAVTDFAGHCGTPTIFGQDVGEGVDPLDATLQTPYGVDVDPSGNVYIADTNNQVVRVVWK